MLFRRSLPRLGFAYEFGLRFLERRGARGLGFFERPGGLGGSTVTTMRRTA